MSNFENHLNNDKEAVPVTVDSTLDENEKIKSVLKFSELGKFLETVKDEDFTVEVLIGSDSFDNYYKEKDTYSINILGEGEINGKFVVGLTGDDANWDKSKLKQYLGVITPDVINGQMNERNIPPLEMTRKIKKDLKWLQKNINININRFTKNDLSPKIVRVIDTLQMAGFILVFDNGVYGLHETYTPPASGTRAQEAKNAQWAEDLGFRD